MCICHDIPFRRTLCGDIIRADFSSSKILQRTETFPLRCLVARPTSHEASLNRYRSLSSPCVVTHAFHPVATQHKTGRCLCISTGGQKVRLCSPIPSNGQGRGQTHRLCGLFAWGFRHARGVIPQNCILICISAAQHNRICIRLKLDGGCKVKKAAKTAYLTSHPPRRLQRAAKSPRLTTRPPRRSNAPQSRVI